MAGVLMRIRNGIMMTLWECDLFFIDVGVPVIPSCDISCKQSRGKQSVLFFACLLYAKEL